MSPGGTAVLPMRLHWHSSIIDLPRLRHHGPILLPVPGTHPGARVRRARRRARLREAQPGARPTRTAVSPVIGSAFWHIA
jgi:hypothetical protein